MLRRSGRDEQSFNSRFQNWVSAGVVNPKIDPQFCTRWFTTHANRGPAADFVLEALSRHSDSGLRLLLRRPPERVRLSRGLTNDGFQSGTNFVAIHVRGLPEAGKSLKLDFLALSDSIIGLTADHASVDGPRYVSPQLSAGRRLKSSSAGLRM